jgi:hypothetical protein
MDRATNGVKRNLLVDKDSVSLAVAVARANVPDATLLAQTMDTVIVERPEPEPNWPQHLCLGNVLRR